MPTAPPVGWEPSPRPETRNVTTERLRQQQHAAATMTRTQDDPYDLQSLPDSSWTRVRLSWIPFFEESTSSHGAKMWSLFILILILASVVAFVIETHPHYHEKGTQAWFVLEAVIVAVFTFEYSTRLILIGHNASVCWRFVKSPLNIIDLAAILPFYIELLVFATSTVSVLRVLRIVRLGRIFRLFKLSKYSANMQLFAEALRKSGEAFGVLLFFLGITILLDSSIMYFLERGHWDEEDRVYYRTCGEEGRDVPSPYGSIIEAFWWCITTITTVGYGDIVPCTAAGKVFAGLTMVLGIMVVAFPITIIGANFNEVYEQHRRRKMARHITKQGGNLQLLRRQWLEHSYRLRLSIVELQAWFNTTMGFLQFAPTYTNAATLTAMQRETIMTTLKSLDRFLLTVPLVEPSESFSKTPHSRHKDGRSPSLCSIPANRALSPHELGIRSSISRVSNMTDDPGDFEDTPLQARSASPLMGPLAGIATRPRTSSTESAGSVNGDLVPETWMRRGASQLAMLSPELELSHTSTKSSTQKDGTPSV